MGLVSAALSTASGVLADQWKDYFVCESMPSDVLAVKGVKKSGGFGNRGSDNIITDGSKIAVADGQCMMIVEQGKVVDVCAESGEYIYDMSSEPSLFTGTLSDAVLNVFEMIGRRFSYGGQAGNDQRVYFFNLKEIIGNKYGTPNPVPFRVVDSNIGLDIDIGIRCFGEFSYKIVNPILFYTNVCGNISSRFLRSDLESQLKTELLSALLPAFAKISEMGIRYSALPAHAAELTRTLNEELSGKWRDLRGIEIVSVGVSSVSASEEDEKMIKDLQRASAFKNPQMAAAQLAGAQASAMQDAARNPNGAAASFMGVNMASGFGAASGIHDLYIMGENSSSKGPAENSAVKGWVCVSCGTVNNGKFCTECGTKKPIGELQYRCDKCGWMPEDPAHPPKFCPECGDPFGDEDMIGK